MGSKKTATKGALAAPQDPRAPLAPTPQACEQTVAGVRAVLERLPQPAEPKPGDLVYAMLHITFAAGLPCGYGQEAVRRIERAFVDRNEFRVTEAFEVVELLDDLGIPNLFERCLAIRDAVAQIYNDQNSVSLDYLRAAQASERTQFFARIPALTPLVTRFLVALLSMEECIFSDRSTQRVQQRLGLDPKAAHVARMFADLHGALAPFGHLPLQVGVDRSDGKVILEPVLSPACLVVRLAPAKR